jgi:transposase
VSIRISNDLKSLVIKEYLQGKSRDEIAQDYELAAGTVSNIIADS